MTQCDVHFYRGQGGSLLAGDTGAPCRAMCWEEKTHPSHSHFEGLPSPPKAKLALDSMGEVA